MSIDTLNRQCLSQKFDLQTKSDKDPSEIKMKPKTFLYLVKALCVLLNLSVNKEDWVFLKTPLYTKGNNGLFFSLTYI